MPALLWCATLYFCLVCHSLVFGQVWYIKSASKWHIIDYRRCCGNLTPSPVAQRFFCCYYTRKIVLCNLWLVLLPQSPYHPVRRCDKPHHASKIPKSMNPAMDLISAIIISIDLIRPRKHFHWNTRNVGQLLWKKIYPQHVQCCIDDCNVDN